MSRMSRLATLLGIALCAATAAASNRAFRLEYDLHVRPRTTGLNWVSAPYYFWPHGRIGETVTSLDWCVALNQTLAPPDTVRNIQRFDTTGDSFTTQACQSPFPAFDLEPGRGYSLIPVTDGVTITIVGSHDDRYAWNKTAEPIELDLVLNPGGTSLNFIAMPYHLKANDVVELCADLNRADPPSGAVLNLQRFDPSSDSWTVHPCGLMFPQFPIIAGESYAAVPSGPGTSISIEVH